MPPFAPLFGALALAASVTASVLHASHSDAARSDRPMAAAALDDPILFYGDPMGGAEVSRHPRKDGMGMDFLPVRRSQFAPFVGKLPVPPAASREEPLFYRDPMGGDDISTRPRKDGIGMDYLPVRPIDLRAVLPDLSAKPQGKRIPYYRNPMGLPDVSSAPKKDSMGMDYTPVYEGEETEADGAVRIAPGKIQRTGVRSEHVQASAAGRQDSRARRGAGRRAPRRRGRNALRGFRREGRRRHDRRARLERPAAGEALFSGHRRGGGGLSGFRGLSDGRREIARRRAEEARDAERAAGIHRRDRPQPPRAGERLLAGAARWRHSRAQRRRWNEGRGRPSAVSHRRSLGRLGAGRRRRAGLCAAAHRPACRRSGRAACRIASSRARSRSSIRRSIAKRAPRACASNCPTPI